jgi:hypothetical protein
MQKIVTIFKNIKEIDTPFHITVDEALSRIRNGKSKDLVQNIRSEKDKEQRNALKRRLPSICFSGKFSKRSDDSLQAHSGLICLDFDNYIGTKELLQNKERLSKSKYVYSVFISPSGSGLKVLVKIPDDVENHKNYFNSLEKHFNSPNFDKTSKNVSRVCYESYDPQIYINPNSSVWDKIEERQYSEYDKSSGKVTIPISDENRIADILVKWWQKKYPMTEGQRNQNTYILAAAMNDFGVNQELAKYVLRQYSGAGFSEGEVNQTVESAYSHSEKFGTRFYEDEDRMNAIRAKFRRGVSKKEIRHQLEDTSELGGEMIEKIISLVESENAKSTFWQKNDKGALKVVHIQFKQFLEDNGFFKYSPPGSKSFVFVRVSNNLIDNTSEKEIKDFVLNYLLDIEDTSVYNYFADNTRFFSCEFLSMIATIDAFFIRDSKDMSYLYFRNCVVMVTPKEIKTIDYIDIGGYVWKDHVIDRDYEFRDVGDKFDYKVFISNVSASDPNRIEAMETTIGYLMHGFKNLAFSPAVILNDEVISDNPEGGTGKGIFMNALSKMKKTTFIDSKLFTFDRFSYQNVSIDTQILCFDDAKKNFSFETLFSVITEGITIEKKNMDSIRVSFERSPKIVITTNYAIRGSGNSFARRKWELEFFQHYNKDYTPQHEFGRMLFGEWDDAMWMQFDNYMISCLSRYLRFGLVKTKFVNLNLRQLSAATCHDFIEWCGLVGNNGDNNDLVTGCVLYKNDLYFKFTEEYPDYGPKAKLTISRTRFYQWLSSYSMYMYGRMPEEGRDSTGRWLIFKELSESANTIINKQSKLAFDDED